MVRAWYAVGVGDNDTTCTPVPTSIADGQGLDEGIRVISNPFRNRILLRYNLEQGETVQVYLADASGRIVYRASPKLPSGKGDYTLELNNTSLSNGWYMLQMVTRRQVFSQKLIKE